MKKDKFLLVHNISEANLDRVMDLGGMVCPSLAFITSKSEFSYYGKITLIADSSLADPQEQPVFDADIYSPIYPSKKVEVSRERANEYLGEIVEKINLRNGTSFGEREINALCAYVYENDKRCLKEFFYDNDLLVLMAAERQGMKVEQDLVPVSFRSQFSEIKEVREFVLRLNGALDRIIESEKELLDIIDRHYDQILSNDELSRISRIFAGNESRRVKEMISNGESFGISKNDLLSMDFKYSSSESDYLSGYTLSTSKSIEEIKSKKPFSRELISEMVDDLFKNIVSKEYFNKLIEKGEYAGGTRKVEYNLKNILREMKSKLRNEKSHYMGIGNLKSLVAKRYRHIDSIRNDVDKIVGEQVYVEKMSEISERIKGIIERVVDADSGRENSLVNVLDKMHCVGDFIFDYIACKGNVDNAFSRAISNDSKLKKDFTKIIKDLKELPSVYFEAKIQRIVYLEEFHTAVIPYETPEYIVSGLIERGLNIKKYNEPDERLNILNSMMLGGKVKELDLSIGI